MANILTFIAVFLFSFPLFSKDLGTFGTCYEIIEEDFAKHLKNKMLKISESDQASLESKMLKSYISSVQHIKDIEGLQKALKYAVRYKDPTIHANQDILDHDGNLIVKKGQRFNPLDVVSMNEDLVFFDATDQEQYSWAIKLKRPSKWILVKGDPLSLENQEGRPVYFDQGGVLVRHFEIKNIPVCISQEGKKLKIEEIAL